MPGIGQTPVSLQRRMHDTTAELEALHGQAGMELTDTEAIVPIGAGCKICNRSACPQRAFPYLGRPVRVDPHISSDLPYSPTTEPA